MTRRDPTARRERTAVRISGRIQAIARALDRAAVRWLDRRHGLEVTWEGPGFYWMATPGAPWKLLGRNRLEVAIEVSALRWHWAPEISKPDPKVLGAIVQVGAVVAQGARAIVAGRERR